MRDLNTSMEILKMPPHLHTPSICKNIDLLIEAMQEMMKVMQSIWNKVEYLEEQLSNKESDVK